MLGVSSLEYARNPIGWWVRSEEFYYAGKALLSTKEKYKNKYYQDFVGKKITNKELFREVQSYMNIGTPIVYNLAFSCELLVKAILVLQDPIRWIPDNKPVKFTHDIFKLVKNEIPITLSDLEIKIAKRLKDFIDYGKYPERRNPGAVNETYKDYFDYHPYVNWSLTEYYEIITSMREKLREYFLEEIEEQKLNKT